MTVTVLVPDDTGVAVLGELAGVRTLRYRSGDPLPAGAAEAEVLVPDFLSDSTAIPLAELPSLRLILTLTAGAEAWVDRLPPGVRLASARGAHGGSTAEWAIGVLLCIYRDLVTFEDARRAGTWSRHITDTLQGKRVLVVGAGDLGQQLVRRLSAFDATATVVASTARDGVRGVEELPRLLGEHDAVVLMVPLTEQTRSLVDAAFLAAMPDGAVLVNAARGPVVDTDALLAELKSGRLRAALDVTDPEPLPPDHPLWTVPGLLLTPHVGGSVHGHRDRAYALVRAELLRHLAGEPPNNHVAG